ncbi:MAG TPA: DinB family protein [Anaeromyxobacteraceae bacterium]|nr:DinB family protein [Anaeromyxobacteraceae bacterium]
MTRDALLTRWEETGSKLVQLADAIPEDRYAFRPTPDVRSVAEQLRHVAFWNDYAAATLRGETPDAAANELPERTHRSRAAILAALRASVDAARTALAAERPMDADADTLVAFLEHAGEHYGQLVVYARLCGVVPPASREA